jgi:hypothetical protein
MFSASAVAFAVLLSAQGDAPTREEKPAQVPPEQVRGTSNPAFETPMQELLFLRKNKPSLNGGATALAIGGAVAVIGAGLALLSLVAVDPRGGVRNEGQVFGLMIGGGVFALGTLIGVIGGIVMGVVGEELTRVDARIRRLEAALGQPPALVRF